MKVKTVKSSHEYRAKLPPKDFKKWMRALRSGKYDQGRGLLQDAHGGFCCLGVACEILISKEDIDRDMDRNYTGDKQRMTGAIPADQEKAPNWLKFIDDDFQTRQELVTPLEMMEKDDLVAIPTMNDSMEMDFNSIADVLELVYVHGILEK